MSTNCLLYEHRENRKRRKEKERKEEKRRRIQKRRTIRETREGEGGERGETDHVGGGAQRLRKTHKQAYYNNGRACCTNTISA